MSASLGMSVLLVALPVSLVGEGHGYSVAALVAGAGGAGAAIGALPTGWATDRWGPERVGVIALGAMCVSALVMGVGLHPWSLGLSHLTFGAGALGVMLSRQADLIRQVPLSLRGRAMASMGGTLRFSMLIGTVAGGVLVDFLGAQWTFLVAGLGAAVGIPAVFSSSRRPGINLGFSENAKPGLWSVVRCNRRRLVHAGLFGACSMTSREGRMVVLPLVGVALNIRPSTIGFLVASGYVADLALFPVAGALMDRFGRRKLMVPAYGLLAIGLGFLSVVESAQGVLVAGLIMGVGNGLSSGSLFTLSSDLAPPEGTASFLAVVSLITDCGRVAGPLLVALVAARWGLGASSAVLGGVMVFGLLWLGLVVGETGAHESETGMGVSGT